jgi:hypothetical protein
MNATAINGAAIRTAGKYLGAWGAIVLGVILLSVIFTFLGTITCAVLVGMMMGAVKGARWFSVLVSLVFPGVIFGMVRTARMELTPQQVVLLGALCFSTFWGTYLVSAFLFFCEQRERKPSKVTAPAGSLAAEPLGSILPARESCLEQLEGNWVCEAASAGEPRHKKIIQIKEAKLELKSIDASGQITLLARGDVMLQSLKPVPTLAVPHGASEPADFIVGL